MKPKSPLSMFIIGVFLNIISLWLLDIVAIVLLILGLFNSVFSKLGLLLTAAILLFAIIKQCIYRHAILTNPEFEEAIGKDGNMQENIMNFIEKQIQSQTPYDTRSDSEKEADPENTDKD